MALTYLKYLRLFNNISKGTFLRVDNIDKKFIQKFQRFSTSVQCMCEDSEYKDPNVENEFRKKEANLEKNILKSALTFVPVHGWNENAISDGAAALGYSQMLHGMFPGGGIDLVNFYYELCNENLEKKLKEAVAEFEIDSDSKRSLSEFLKMSLEIRLRMNIEYIDHMSEALAIHFCPNNLPTAVHNVGTLVDHIWYYAGDRSVDFNWYQKRFAIAAVYKSTELCMIQDKSEDYQETWKFLDRRLKQLKSLAETLRDTETTAKDIEKFGKAAVITLSSNGSINYEM